MHVHVCWTLQRVTVNVGLLHEAIVPNAIPAGATMLPHGLVPHSDASKHDTNISGLSCLLCQRASKRFAGKDTQHRCG